jgi:hypothetical protein
LAGRGEAAGRKEISQYVGVIYAILPDNCSDPGRLEVALCGGEAFGAKADEILSPRSAFDGMMWVSAGNTRPYWVGSLSEFAG